jgi:hypothetical protein
MNLLINTLAKGLLEYRVEDKPPVTLKAGEGRSSCSTNERSIHRRQT